MRFCCHAFQRDWNLHREGLPNIRIVKIDVIEVPEIDSKYPYRFYLTVGYEENDKNVPRRALNYCPCCGQNLNEFYKSDVYINEQNQSFLWH